MIWLVLAFLVVCSGTISACETALFGLTRQTLHHFERSGSASLRRVFRLMQRPRRVLMTVLITNTAVNVAIFVVSFVALSRYRDAHPTWAAAGGVLTLLVVIIFLLLVQWDSRTEWRFGRPVRRLWRRWRNR